MGPYRANAAPLRARREELRLELAALLVLAVALQSRHTSHCVVGTDRSIVVDGFSDVRRYP